MIVCTSAAMRRRPNCGNRPRAFGNSAVIAISILLIAIVSCGATRCDDYLRSNSQEAHIGFFTCSSGTLPRELGSYSNLKSLHFDCLTCHNRPSINCCDKLSGTIPDSVRYLKLLNMVWLDGTKISGTIPKGIFAPQVTDPVRPGDSILFRVRSTKLSGRIPSVLLKTLKGIGTTEYPGSIRGGGLLPWYQNRNIFFTALKVK